MDWKTMLAYITGSVDEDLLLRNEYLTAEGNADGRSNERWSPMPFRPLGFRAPRIVRVLRRC